MADNNPPISRLWILRLMLQVLDQEGSHTTEKLLPLLSRYLPALRGLTRKTTDLRCIRSLIKTEIDHTAECCLPVGRTYPQLCAVSKQFGLSEVEQTLLAISVFINKPDTLDLVEQISLRRREHAQLLFARVTGVDIHALKRAMRPASSLSETGLVTFEVNDLPFRVSLAGWIRPQESLDEEALIDPRAWGRFIETNVRRVPVIEPTVSVAGFPHLSEHAELVHDMLRAAKDQSCGVQLLLYGAPGVGKTSFALALAQAANMQVYEVGVAEQDGDARNGLARFRAYRLAQRLLDPAQGQVVLFDDADDLFAGRGFDGSSEPSTVRGWINRGLELRRTSAIWTVNSLDAIPSQHLRRFDYLLEVPAPPASVHKAMIVRALGDQCDDAWLERVGGGKNLTPALVGQARRIASLVSKGSEEDFMQVFEQVLTTNLHGQGKSLRTKRETIALPYDISFLNTDISVESVIEGLSRNGQGRLLLVGPPGTGKTALAKHVAERLGKPLRRRRPSDILNMYVGATEKQIAVLFHEAEEEGAVLFLDEVDSLLYDRDEMAVRSWEVSQTNELLSRMEEFRGILLSATNRFDALDPAVKRRFDIKVEFEYLTATQAMKCLVSLLGAMQACCDSNDLDECRQRLAKLNNLALGDFAALHRRFQLLDLATNSVEAVIVQLERLSREKPGQPRPIGFIVPNGSRQEGRLTKLNPTDASLDSSR